MTFRFRACGLLAVALVAALGLGACGRKSGLAPPPSAAIAPQQQPGQPAPQAETEQRGPRDLFSSEDQKPAPPPAAPKKSFFLDFLVN